jgi:hypothetical protein
MKETRPNKKPAMTEFENDKARGPEKHIIHQRSWGVEQWNKGQM